MNKDSNKANTAIKQKRLVWKIKVEVNSQLLEKQYEIKPETKFWEIKVILN